MRFCSSSPGSLAGRLTLLILTSLYAVPLCAAVNFTAATSLNLDLTSLGHVALAGNFDALSLYEWLGQNQATYTLNGSQSILSRFPNGAFAHVAQGDANINAMCPWVKDGVLHGIVIGGNFTSLDNQAAQGVALFNPNTSQITPISGLTGSVKSLYCDSDSGIVYMGGFFNGENSTNAIAWANDKFQDLPFAGFNGPVYSIVKDADGHLVFGGSFNGLGNTSTPAQKDKQVIPLGAGNITASGSSSTDGFSDPKNIVCKTGQGGSGNVWLLQDNTAGYWKAEFQFGFQPTKLRLYNTNQDGRGTQTWRYTALPDNGIMNFTYIDSDGQNKSCDARCPLPQGNTTYQDFRFVNKVGMNSFRIDISAWYGSGAGLAGIELYQDDIYAFAINSFNEPTCTSVNQSAQATTTGNWQVEPSHSSSSEWLSVNFTSGEAVNSTSASVVFEPNIPEAGDYTVLLYTPGCKQDNSCEQRGIVNITGIVRNSSSTSSSAPISTTLYQTNYYDKYDTIYYGYVDEISASFRPSITLTPADGQTGPLNVVAQRMRFELMSANSGGLNGIYDYDPSNVTVSDDLSSSPVNAAGNSLGDEAVINAMVTDANAVFLGGNFSSSNVSNIFAIRDNTSMALADRGLNAEVHALYLNGSELYVGGNFTNTADNNVEGLAGVAVYSISDNTWSALGAGVQGSVTSIVPMQLNLTSGSPEYVISVSGDITEVRAFGSNETFAVEGVALWSPSRKNWVHNLEIASISVAGRFSVMTEVPGSEPLYAGSISSQAVEARGIVSLLEDDDTLGLSPYFINVDKNTNSNSSGVTTAMVYDENNINVTILGGQFTATSSNGTTFNNLIFVDSANNNAVTGLTNELNATATVKTLATSGTTLYVGGQFRGNVTNAQIDGLLVWDLQNGKASSTQPQSLVKDNGQVSVNAVAPRPSSSSVFVGGNFDSAGAFGCPALCVYATDRGQWTSPGGSIEGSVSSLYWISQNQLMVAGNITVGGNTTTLALFNAKQSNFQTVNGASNVPGVVNSMTAANSDGSQFWIAGTATNGSSFVMLTASDPADWKSIGWSLGDDSVVKGIQVLPVSKNHDSSDNIDKDKVLVVLGDINLPNVGKVSAAVYNGTDFSPFVLSTQGNNQGSLSQIFVQKPQNVFKSNGGKLALGLVVLASLAIALGLTMAIVVTGIVAERIRRRKEGWMPAPTSMGDKNTNLNRIPPEHILGNLDNPGHERL